MILSGKMEQMVGHTVLNLEFFFFFFLGKILNSELVLGTLTCEIFAGVANYFMARGDSGLGKSQKLKVVEWRRVGDSHSVHTT